MEAVNPPDIELLAKLNTAVAAANEAEKTAETAKAELVSRSRAVGLLLLEAKKLHPAVKNFEAFLKRVNGLQRSRAYDLMSLAGGRKTEEKLKEEARERQQRLRALKKRLPKPSPALKKPEPEPKQVSVTDPHVTETAEAGAKTRKAEKEVPSWMTAARQSSHWLAEFTFACRTYLPRITVEADREEARQLVAELTTEPKAEAA